MDTNRKAANLSVDALLLKEAERLNLDISRVFEVALRDAVARARRELRRAENRAALITYNRHIERDGVFSDGLRTS
jgi:antitoxin CcdA